VHTEIVIRPAADADVDALVALWQEAGLTRPWNDPREGIRRARAVWPDLLALGCPKVMLMVRADNTTVLDWYDGLGYSRETTALTGRRLIPEG